MLDGFQNLAKSEIDSLVEAPALITILIGAADGELDPEERKWTERLLRTRTYNRPKELNEYYRVVVQDFWEKVQAFMASLPVDAADRNEAIAARLEQLNPVLAKLEVDLASDLYQGFVGLAEETAKASGGFLRMGAISAVESKWVNLPMLVPIHHEHEDEQVDSED
ncbi:MAG: hypothetical protein IPK76_25655 [Lewinellaceae bacterium]|nr:hypothetical protein [Lewinellaceae bacterium]